MIPTTIRCSTCPFYQPLSRSQPEDQGICHAHPPTPLMVGVNTLTKRPLIEAHMTAVSGSYWCGEHPSLQLTLAATGLRSAGPAEPIRNGEAQDVEVAVSATEEKPN